MITVDRKTMLPLCDVEIGNRFSHFSTCDESTQSFRTLFQARTSSKVYPSSQGFSVIFAAATGHRNSVCRRLSRTLQGDRLRVQSKRARNLEVGPHHVVHFRDAFCRECGQIRGNIGVNETTALRVLVSGNLLHTQAAEFLARPRAFCSGCQCQGLTAVDIYLDTKLTR